MYVGKPHPEIVQLLDILEHHSTASQWELTKKLTAFEKKFAKKFTFLEGRVKVTLWEFVIYISFLTIYTIAAIKLDVRSGRQAGTTDTVGKANLIVLYKIQYSTSQMSRLSYNLSGRSRSLGNLSGSVSPSPSTGLCKENSQERLNGLLANVYLP